MSAAKRQRTQQAPDNDDQQAARAFTDMAALNEAMQHLQLADARLAPLIESFGAPERLLKKSTSCFTSLAKAIIYQQLAGSAAAAIYARFLTACKVPDESLLNPAAVLAAPLPALRACGLSERKASYLLDLAAHFSNGRLSDELLTSVSDAELLQRLTAVRGIGPWTVDMFAMFHLGSPDILPVGDLGVRKGLAQLCGLQHLPSPSEMQELTAGWAPYRSLGSYFMWRIPLPPKSSKSSSSSNSSGAKAKKAARAPAPAFPLGGAVPALADANVDVGVNPLSPALAAGGPAAVGPAATPVKPLAGAVGAAAAAAAAGAAAAAAEQPPSAAEGMMTRRRLRWAQGNGGAAATAGNDAADSSNKVTAAGLRARVVDL